MTSFLGTDANRPVARGGRTITGRLARLLAGSSLSALLLAGCGVRPEVITPADKKLINFLLYTVIIIKKIIKTKEFL